MEHQPIILKNALVEYLHGHIRMLELMVSSMMKKVLEAVEVKILLI